MLFWKRGKLSDQQQLDRFFAQYNGRTLILHQDFPPAWFEELVKLPGGGGHFRLDIRNLQDAKPSPVEWIAERYLLALHLPLPFFVMVKDDALLVRHLTRGGSPVHPSEILLFMDELESRHHALLRREGERLEVSRGIDVEDNEPQALFG